MALTVPLASNELKKVKARSKSSRPTYFSALNGIDVEISEDTEAFLILLKPEVKIKMAQYIQTVTSAEDLRTDRDELLLEFLTDDIDQLKSASEEALSASGDFALYTNILSTGKFGRVEDVTLLLKDLARGFPERLSLVDKLRFQTNQALVVKDKMELSNYWGGFESDDYKKQFQSWLGPILSYI